MQTGRLPEKQTPGFCEGGISRFWEILLFPQHGRDAVGSVMPQIFRVFVKAGSGVRRPVETNPDGIGKREIVFNRFPQGFVPLITDF